MGAMDLFVVLMGVVIGLVIGAMGAGGSILAVPFLVYVVGLNAKAATTASLIVVSFVALSGMTAHWRAGRVRVASGALFGLAGIAGSVAGSFLNRAISSEALLLAFSGLMIVAALAMLRRVTRPEPDRRNATADMTDNPTLAAVRSTATPNLALAGTGAGLVTGLFGIGGGFITVPALCLILGFTMHEAVGTSLLVAVINATVALLSRFGMEGIPWVTVIVFALGGLAGALLGSRIAGKMRSETLTRWFAGLIVVIAVYTAARTIAAF
jgi:uncharacterized membrane protein YfcA